MWVGVISPDVHFCMSARGDGVGHTVGFFACRPCIGRETGPTKWIVRIILCDVHLGLLAQSQLSMLAGLGEGTCIVRRPASCLNYRLRGHWEPGLAG